MAMSARTAGEATWLRKTVAVAADTAACKDCHINHHNVDSQWQSKFARPLWLSSWWVSVDAAPSALGWVLFTNKLHAVSISTKSESQEALSQ